MPFSPVNWNAGTIVAYSLKIMGGIESVDRTERVNTVTDHECFGCGEENPIGLHLAFYRDGDRVRARFTPRTEYEGYLSQAHGGIAATALDEAMSWAVIAAGGRLPVTTRLEITFRRPMPVGESVTVFGEVVRDRKRVVEAKAEIRDAAGVLIATATGSFVRVPLEQHRAWEERYLNPDRE